MGRTLSRDELRTLLDQVTRDITNEAGVVLRPLDGGEQAPGDPVKFCEENAEEAN